MNTNMTGFKGFSCFPCVLDESSLSTVRVKLLMVETWLMFSVCVNYSVHNRGGENSFLFSSVSLLFFDSHQFFSHH